MLEFITILATASYMSEKSYNQYIDWFKNLFFNELENYSKRIHEGHSILEKGNFISLMLVCNNRVNGDFCDHSIKKTCLIKQNDNISDLKYYKKVSDDENCDYIIKTIYHQLPDGKLVEYKVEEDYEKELQNIYNTIIKIRTYYDLNISLPENTSEPQFKI